MLSLRIEYIDMEYVCVYSIFNDFLKDGKACENLLTFSLLCTDPCLFPVCVIKFMVIFVFVCLYVLMGFRECSYSDWLSCSPMFLLCFCCLCSRMLNK